LTEPTKRPAASATTGKSSSRRTSTSPTGTRRAGRRETARRRYDEPTTLERFRTPIIVVVAAVAVIAVSAFVFTSASAPAYACTTVDTVQPAVEGQLGQVQPDMGNTHVGRGDKVTYPVCPPASGKHINQPPYGPIKPGFYGPDDAAAPNGWVHNLEHGGLVVLYSVENGGGTDADIQALQSFVTGFPASPVCNLPAGYVSPVVARFDQMPTKYAALVWNRVLYLDTLDTNQILEFFNRYAEVVGDDGQLIAPPEAQCAAPSPSAEASPGASAEASPSAAASASPSAAASASPSQAVSASPAPSVEASPSPSAS
jgi:hypothetical protein